MTRAITYEHVCAGTPADAEQARWAIAKLDRECRSRSNRILMAGLVLRKGNYTAEGKRVWQEYLARTIA